MSKDAAVDLARLAGQPPAGVAQRQWLRLVWFGAQGIALDLPADNDATPEEYAAAALRRGLSEHLTDLAAAQKTAQTLAVRLARYAACPQHPQDKPADDCQHCLDRAAYGTWKAMYGPTGVPEPEPAGLTTCPSCGNPYVQVTLWGRTAAGGTSNDRSPDDPDGDICCRFMRASNGRSHEPQCRNHPATHIVKGPGMLLAVLLRHDWATRFVMDCTGEEGCGYHTAGAVERHHGAPQLVDQGPHCRQPCVDCRQLVIVGRQIDGAWLHLDADPDPDGDAVLAGDVDAGPTVLFGVPPSGDPDFFDIAAGVPRYRRHRCPPNPDEGMNP